MITLVIKGNRHQAMKAATCRKLAFKFQRETKYGETVGYVSDIEMDSVRRWYNEPGDAPYPVGALLLWHEGGSVKAGKYF